MLFRAGSHPDARPFVDTEVLVARRHLLGLYLLLGLSLSSWLARLPTVRAELDLSTAALGTVMLVGAAGSLVTILSSGALVARWGGRVTLLASAGVFSLGYVLLGVGPAVGQVSWLAAGVVLISVGFALGNVPLNVESVAIEQRMRRTVVPQFHAAFSLGSVLGSGLGALTAWAQVPVLVQFSAMSALALAWRMYSVPRAVLTPTAGRPTGGRGGLRSSLGAWRERRTLLIGLVVMAAALSEGSANNWLTLAVVDGFAAQEAVAAVVFAVFVASMTTARLAGTWAIDRFGRYPVLVGSGVSALVGLLTFALAPSLTVSVVGVVAWGLGAGLVVPIGMAAVSGDALHAPARVAVVSAFASVASIGAPPLIGAVAGAVGIRHALLVITGVMLAGVLVSGVVREPATDRPVARSGHLVPTGRRPARRPAPAELVEEGCR